MSFLSQLKDKAAAVQAEKTAAQSLAQQQMEKNVMRTEAVCRTTLTYLTEMVRQLNILAPAGPHFTVDGKTPWPAMKLVDFRVDSRKKYLNDKEVFSSISVGWDILPKVGQPVSQKVTVNFMPELQKVENRLQMGNVRHDKTSIRHPEKQSVQAIQFVYTTQTTGSITVTPNHEAGTLSFRFANVNGLAVQTASWDADLIDSRFLDELAKLVVSQPSRLMAG